MAVFGSDPYFNPNMMDQGHALSPGSMAQTMQGYGGNGNTGYNASGTQPGSSSDIFGGIGNYFKTPSNGVQPALHNISGLSNSQILPAVQNLISKAGGAAAFGSGAGGGATTGGGSKYDFSSGQAGPPPNLPAAPNFNLSGLWSPTMGMDQFLNALQFPGNSGGMSPGSNYGASTPQMAGTGGTNDIGSLIRNVLNFGSGSGAGAPQGAGMSGPMGPNLGAYVGVSRNPDGSYTMNHNPNSPSLASLGANWTGPNVNPGIHPRDPVPIGTQTPTAWGPITYQGHDQWGQAPNMPQWIRDLSSGGLQYAQSQAAGRASAGQSVLGDPTYKG